MGKVHHDSISFLKLNQRLYYYKYVCLCPYLR
nr:MAG TPA: hypothetical protein [Caudoviricetes sp.]